LSAAGVPGAGTLQSGAIETSNVDMTNELVQLIKAQQLYNGNARALQTQVEVASRVTDKL
jgi:flagellar hook protein FlgE